MWHIVQKLQLHSKIVNNRIWQEFRLSWDITLAVESPHRTILQILMIWCGPVWKKWLTDRNCSDGWIIWDIYPVFSHLNPKIIDCLADSRLQTARHVLFTRGWIERTMVRNLNFSNKIVRRPQHYVVAAFFKHVHASYKASSMFFPLGKSLSVALFRTFWLTMSG